MVRADWQTHFFQALSISEMMGGKALIFVLNFAALFLCKYQAEKTRLFRFWSFIFGQTNAQKRQGLLVPKFAVELFVWFSMHTPRRRKKHPMFLLSEIFCFLSCFCSNFHYCSSAWESMDANPLEQVEHSVFLDPIFLMIIKSSLYWGDIVMFCWKTSSGSNFNFSWLPQVSLSWDRWAKFSNIALSLRTASGWPIFVYHTIIYLRWTPGSAQRFDTGAWGPIPLSIGKGCARSDISSQLPRP